MKWKQPPIIKVYEALGAVSDGRVEVIGNSAKVYSSSRNKYYDVLYDPEHQAIMTNDNGSYWKGYLGYPAIAFLLKIQVINYREELAMLLKGIPWKDLNQKTNNDFDQTLETINEKLTLKDRSELREYAESILKALEQLSLDYLGKRIKPPVGY